jgi:hypothetical protein
VVLHKVTDIDKYILELYEKVYFHEIDLREKLLSRFELSFGIAVPLFAAIAYLLLNIDFEKLDVSKYSLLFKYLFGICGLCSFLAMLFFG